MGLRAVTIGRDRRSAMRTFVALAMIGATALFVPCLPHASASAQPTASAANVDPRVITLLREAIATIEQMPPDRRLGVQAQIGRLLRTLKLDAQFDGYGNDAIATIEARVRNSIPTSPEREARG